MSDEGVSVGMMEHHVGGNCHAATCDENRDTGSSVVLGFDELKATLDTTFEIFDPIEGKDPLAPRSGLVDLVPVRIALVELISRFRPQPGELIRYALFDCSKPYTRNCIAQTDRVSHTFAFAFA